MEDTQSSRSAFLVVIATPTPSELGKRYDVVGEGTIGRSKHANIVVCGDEGMSRVHCHLEPAQNGWVLRDLSSTHGTRANGEWIDGPYVLEDGSKFTLGQTMFKLLDGACTPPVLDDSHCTPRKLDGLTDTITKWWFCNRNQDFMEPDVPAVAIGLDIVDFKAINDTYGHLAGDHILRGLGHRLMRVVGDAGFVIRFGGEEFVVVLPTDSLAVADDLGATLRAIVREMPLQVDLWMGTTRRQTGQSLGDFLSAALDAAHAEK